MSIRIAICEDEKAQANYIVSVVEKWADKNTVSATICCYESAESFLFTYEEQGVFDILLLDIQMGGMNGIELAKLVRQQDKRMQIIFVTAVSAFATSGYDVSALHYLIKPIDEKKLFEVLLKACENIKKESRFVTIINADGDSIRLFTADILYAESFGHIAEIVTTGEKVKTKIPINELEVILGEGFIRCHRSYIAGIRNIKKIMTSEIVFDNGEKIPLSRRLYNNVNHSFIGYYKG